MKKILAIAAVVAVAGSASASSVGFAFGTNFYKSAITGGNAANGQTFSVSWNLDNDLALGVYNENVGGGTYTESAISIAKGVMKNVAVGLNLGSGTTGGPVNPVADVFGSVNILSGSGDKVTGSLQAVVLARFGSINTANDADGYSAALNVAIGF